MALGFKEETQHLLPQYHTHVTETQHLLPQYHTHVTETQHLLPQYHTHVTEILTSKTVLLILW